ncbi:hypothetical protein P280DRAFT_469783 [Massarina eburnea CBS 473.64]|uniref:Uncharacterized protein n=1 Tax=Massarina eburnea CBS 473.64 TaxID=1395130 RepID=A0A6A6RYK6_9PLEO|nr:hypothetical protein P280DRAFT_469783 [Massarina eburnea CBS 473.64]
MTDPSPPLSQSSANSDRPAAPFCALLTEPKKAPGTASRKPRSAQPPRYLPSPRSSHCYSLAMSS